MANGVYSQKNVNGTYANIPLTGKLLGAFAKLALKVPDQLEWVSDGDGAGNGCFVQSADPSGSAEWTLDQASPVNAQLLALFNQQQAGTAGPGAFVLNDLNGTYIGQIAIAMIAGPPERTYSEGKNGLTWKFVGSVLQQSGGGVT